MILLFLLFRSLFYYSFIKVSLLQCICGLSVEQADKCSRCIFLNCPQDYLALQILFMSLFPQSAYQAAL